ncbi:hypothetical protein A3C96_02285 [Candidatus Uhrbacteria bacterium RIFCSPHIGHO2_02_FULL_60_10]|uniref:histidine kinase n=1 Tax=Candidatus Uhrbacteria bacterium RIFCSPHIGHO2_02_FULL_60_10 TaxID=1802392 RepID=A0A1F7U510_9BACT|nr:MAG: hypothetical protein A3C96_02285 [Candidatus Uhrbacteria bacterium RIFCSPHIGHO2_02_FULL_60_10]
MKIKTLLLLSSATLVVFTISIGSLVFFATRDTERLAAQGTQAEKLIAEVFELNSLAQDYVSRHEERPRVQWYLQFNRLSQRLDSPVLDDEPSRSYLTPLRSAMAGIKVSFDRLVAQSDAAATNSAIEKQLAGDLLVKTRRMISGIDELAKAAFRGRAEARSRTDRLIFVLLLLLVATTGTIAVILFRRIVAPIVKLQKGAEIIGRGNLTHRVGGDARDEIGQLSRAFDDMTAKLKRSHDNLEKKVKERTKELEDLSKQNRIMLESIGDGLIAIDKEWNITLWNPAAAKIAGWSKEEALGQPLRKIVRFVRRTDRTENALFISDAMMDGKVHFMEPNTVMIRKDGAELDVSDSAAPILDQKGAVKGAIVVFRDTSREKELERSRNDLVSLVTHELRGPASIIQGYVELIKERGGKTPAADQKKYIQGIYDANEKLVELANSLLTVFRVDFGDVVINPQPVDVAILGDKALKQLELPAAAKKLKIAKEYDEALPIINADKNLTELVFGNFLSNAVKYTPEGGRVRLEIRKRGAELHIVVSDTGLGIPKGQQAKIFEKFFRASNVKAISGVGVGLHVLKAMTERAGCRIGFESEEGKGSTFFVAIPVTGMIKVGT